MLGESCQVAAGESLKRLEGMNQKREVRIEGIASNAAIAVRSSRDIRQSLVYVSR